MFMMKTVPYYLSRSGGELIVNEIHELGVFPSYWTLIVHQDSSNKKDVMHHLRETGMGTIRCMVTRYSGIKKTCLLL